MESSVWMESHQALQQHLCPVSGLCNIQLFCTLSQSQRVNSKKKKTVWNHHVTDVTLEERLCNCDHQSIHLWKHNRFFMKSARCTVFILIKKLREKQKISPCWCTCACILDAAPPVEVRTLEVLLSTFFCCSAILYLQAALRYSLSWKMASAWYTSSWYFWAGDKSSLEQIWTQHIDIKYSLDKDDRLFFFFFF